MNQPHDHGKLNFQHQKPHSKQQKSEMEPPKQANLQFVDDTWERLLNALERLEQVTEKFSYTSASRLDRHTDKHDIREDELDVRSEVHLQIKALQRVIHPVKDEVSWLIEDFLTWFAGREPRQIAQTDEYAVPILKCLSGLPYDLPHLPEVGPPTQNEMMRAVEAVGAGLHLSDGIIETFVENPDQQATKSRHLRGTVDQGMKRFRKLDDPWTATFQQQFMQQKHELQKNTRPTDQQWFPSPHSSVDKSRISVEKPPVSSDSNQVPGTSRYPNKQEETIQTHQEQGTQDIPAKLQQQNRPPETKEDR